VLAIKVLSSSRSIDWVRLSDEWFRHSAALAPFGVINVDEKPMTMLGDGAQVVPLVDPLVELIQVLPPDNRL
jgi:hypothetical protein